MCTTSFPGSLILPPHKMRGPWNGVAVCNTNAVVWLATLLNVYLNNRVLMSRNYRLIVACSYNRLPERRSFESKYATFKNIKFLRGNYQTDSSESWTPHCFYCSPLNSHPHPSSKINWIIWNFLRWEPWKSNVKFEKENRQNLLNTIQLFIFYKSACFHPGIFLGRALWADSVLSVDEHYRVTWSI